MIESRRGTSGSKQGNKGNNASVQHRLDRAMEQLECRRLLSGYTLGATLVDTSAEDFSSAGGIVTSSGNSVLVGLPGKSVDVTGDNVPEFAVGGAVLFDATTGTVLRTFENPGATEGDNFGAAVTFTADGKIAISAPGFGTTGAAGKVYVYDNASDTTPVVVFNPDPALGQEIENFGSRMFAIGNDLLVQTALDTVTDRGVVTRFDLDGTDAPSTYFNPNATAVNDNFGAAAAVSPDGTRILFSATVLSGNPFAPTEGIVYELSATNGTLLRTFSEPAATANGSHGFGANIKWSGDHILISAPDADPFNPFTTTGYVYQFSDTTGDEVRTYASSDVQAFGGVGFGAGLAVSNDGATVAVGAPFQTRLAQVQAYDDDENPLFDEFGNPVLIEAPVSSGAAYVFDLNTGAELATLENPAIQPTFFPAGTSDAFGLRVVSVGGAGFAVSNPYADPGTSTDTGAVYVFNSEVITPVNQPSVVNTGGAYVINEGDGLTLNGSGTSDPDVSDVLSYAWDVNTDGVIDATGVSPVLSGAQLALLGLNDDGVFVVTLTVDDGAGAVVSATTSLTVSNVAPTLTSLAGPTSGQTNQALSYTALASDPGADVLAYAWTVTNADSVIVASANGTGFSFTPNVAGTFTIALDVTDGDGGAAAGSIALSVVLPPSGPTAVIDGAGNLVVTGTAGNDVIEIRRALSGTAVSVAFNGSIVATFAPSGDIVVNGGAGHDFISVREDLAGDAYLYGEDGNDTIIGGGGSDWLFGGAGDDQLRARGENDVLVGGAGADLLAGGDGRDILIGGTGADRIAGRDGEDVLIAGSTSFDNNLIALQAIKAEWSSAGSYTTRVNNLRIGGGLNGSVVLDTDVTVFDDGVRDVLTGGQDTDWFIFQADGTRSVSDRITDLSGAEFADDLAFINA